MLLTECKKASIYSLQNVYLCDAAVSNAKENAVLLTLSDTGADFLTSEVYVTFYDGILGLVTYFCELSAYKEFMPSPGVWNSSVQCAIRQQISVLQRRNDLKVPIDLQTTLSYTTEADMLISIASVIRNISAGGIFFTCRYPFRPGHVVSFRFLPRRDMPPLCLHAQVLRIQDRDLLREMIGHEADDEALLGFGCRFIDLTPHDEAQIRNFVYRQDLLRRKKGSIY